MSSAHLVTELDAAKAMGGLLEAINDDSIEWSGINTVGWARSVLAENYSATPEQSLESMAEGWMQVANDIAKAELRDIIARPFELEIMDANPESFPGLLRRLRREAIEENEAGLATVLSLFDSKQAVGLPPGKLADQIKRLIVQAGATQ